MAWRNLRSEISEMFTEYSRGEELSEYVQELWIERHQRALQLRTQKNQRQRERYHSTYKHDPACKARQRATSQRYWWKTAKHNPVIRARRKAWRTTYREQNRSRIRKTNAEIMRRRTRREWEQEPAVQCLCCGATFKRPLRVGPPPRYCSPQCRRNYQIARLTERRRAERQMHGAGKEPA